MDETRIVGAGFWRRGVLLSSAGSPHQPVRLLRQPACRLTLHFRRGYVAGVDTVDREGWTRVPGRQVEASWDRRRGLYDSRFHARRLHPADDWRHQMDGQRVAPFSWSHLGFGGSGCERGDDHLSRSRAFQHLFPIRDAGKSLLSLAL